MLKDIMIVLYLSLWLIHQEMEEGLSTQVLHHRSLSDYCILNWRLMKKLKGNGYEGNHMGVLRVIDITSCFFIILFLFFLPFSF